MNTTLTTMDYHAQEAALHHLGGPGAVLFAADLSRIRYEYGMDTRILTAIRTAERWAFNPRIDVRPALQNVQGIIQTYNRYDSLNLPIGSGLAARMAEYTLSAAARMAEYTLSAAVFHRQGSHWSQAVAQVVSISFLSRIPNINGLFRDANLHVPPTTSTQAKTLAKAIVQDRDLASLPVLADALEEAGCTDPKLLHNLRDTSKPKGLSHAALRALTQDP